MRAREFITEQATLPPEQADPMNHVFALPGVQSSDPYQIYRLGVAMARARSDAGADKLDLPAWSAEAAFGENAVIAGFDAKVEPVIDQALKMAGLSPKKIQISTPNSLEPSLVNHTSPVKAFTGYSG